MAVTVTGPLGTPTTIVATPSAGGSLAASTRYYYKVLAQSHTSTGFINSGNFRRSDWSAEQYFDTDGTNKQAVITWDAITGAGGYVIIMSTTSGSYTGTNRLGASATAVTTTTNSYTATAVPTISNAWTWEMLDSTSYPMPGGLPRLAGNVSVRYSGTTTLSDIYTAVVAAGYGNYIFWDGVNFIMNGGFNDTSTDSGSLTAKGVNIVLLAPIFLSNTNCTMTLGESISSSYRYATTLTLLSYASGGGNSWKSNLSMYGVMIRGKGPYNSMPYAFGDFRVSPVGTIFKDTAMIDGVSLDGAWTDANNLTINTLLILSSVNTQISWDLKIIYPGPGVYPNVNCYGTHYRMTCLFTGGSDLLCKSHASSTNNLPMYDLSCPFRTSNLPTINWIKYASDTIWPTVFLYYTCLVRVVDENGTGISGATVVLKDVAEATEKSTTTNADGYFLDEAIAITSATTTTISDSSKSWTTNAHKGKKIIITSGTNAGQRCVVVSNTGTALTFQDALAVACSAGDRAGFPFFSTRCEINKDPANGGGVGLAYQILTNKNPHNITVSKSGYKTYQSDITIDRIMDLEIALSKVKDLNFSKSIKRLTQ